MTSQPPEIETDLRAGEMGIALLTAAAFFFGGWLGILPAAWFVWSISHARLEPTTRRRLLAPLRVPYRYVRYGELPAGTSPQLARALLATPAQPATPVPASVEAVRPADDLFATLEAPPHRLIIGHTRGGKTTLIHHLATSWAARGERVLVGDPDAAPGLWPGCEVRGAGDDVASIGELLGIVAAEVEQRRQQRAQGVRQFAPLHLVIDEAQDVLPVLDGGLQLFEDVARRGGKLNVKMTIGVQDKQVKTLGLDGKSHILRNLQTLDVLKNREGRRVAILRDAETNERVSLAIPELPDPERLIVAPAPAPAPTAATGATTRIAAAPAELAALLADVPADWRQAVPSLSPDRAARLSAIMERQGVRVERGEGGSVTVNVAQVAAPARPTPPARLLSPAELHARRQWAQYYRRAARDGIPFDRAYKEAPVRGNRNRAHAVYKAAQESFTTERALPGHQDALVNP